MTQICEPVVCTGCSACANICPKSAVQMRPDCKGFLRPAINPSSCVECGLCAKTCPQNDTLEHRTPGRVFAGLAINDQVRADSSSGGIFSLLAASMIKNNGVVFGAALDKDLSVRHILIDSLEGIAELRGSKYVQSDIGDAYQKVKEQLAVGVPVLFSGTPCQIDALYHCLGNGAKDNLLTVDILCHGVPSPAVFRKFVTQREAKCISINFRKKDPGWDSFSTELTYEDGVTEIDNSYYYFFNGSYCLRESCHQCKYSNVSRVGDITLGDYWGYSERSPEYIENDDLGISFVSVNSRAGQEAISEIKHKAVLEKREIQDAMRGNPILMHPPTPSEKCKDFWEDFQSLTWEDLTSRYHISREKRQDRLTQEQRKYYQKSFRIRHLRHRTRRRIRSLLRQAFGRIRRRLNLK